MKSRIKGYYGSYSAAQAAVGKKFLESRRFSIQRSRAYSETPWVLIYYGNFV